MSRPTVCFVHGDALDLFRGQNGPRFGGAETQMYLLAKALADDREFGVRLVADKDVTGAAYPGVDFKATMPPVQHGVPYLSRFINRARARRPYAGLERAVLLQTILGEYTVATWRLARSLGHAFVYRMSCDADIDGSIFTPEAARLYHEALRDADGVIAQSEAQRERLRTELGVESTVVRGIVDLPKDGPAPGGSHVLWAGRAAAIKRPWIMVETARVMPDVQFVMLMLAEEGVVGSLNWRCFAQEAERIPNLRIVPGVPYFEMADRYREAAIFANTSAIEGVPNVFLQAVAQGTPVVSLEVDPDGMLEAEDLGYCAGGDIDRFREAIATYLSRPELVRRQGQAGYEYIRTRHSVDAVMPVFKRFLAAVLEP